MGDRGVSDRAAREGLVPVLWLCGPSGVGKTAAGWRIYSDLIGSGIHAGYVDIDQLGMCYPEPSSDPGRHRMKGRNLCAVVAGFQRAGARCVVVSGVVDVANAADVEQLRGADLTVCRLRVHEDELRERFLSRGEPEEQVQAVLREAHEMDHSTIADLCIDTTGLTVSEVAREVRQRASGWPDLTNGISASPAPPCSSEWGGAAGGPILWLFGATGVGKSAAGFAAYVKVLRSRLAAAYVDVDQIAFCGPAPTDDHLRASNLAAMWNTYRAAGARASSSSVPSRTRPWYACTRRPSPKPRSHGADSMLAAIS